MIQGLIKVSLAEEKNKLRSEWKLLLKDLPSERRLKAASLANDALILWVKNNAKKIPILSFASFSTEIDLWPFNQFLMQEGLLILPKTVKNQLSLHLVSNQESLKKNAFGILEPDDKALVFLPQKIAFAFIPALAFDSRGNRLGFGGGFYDRLLAQFSPLTKTFGVGFKEQLSEKTLPTLSHDLPVKALMLF